MNFTLPIGLLPPGQYVVFARCSAGGAVRLYVNGKRVQ